MILARKSWSTDRKNAAVQGASHPETREDNCNGALIGNGRPGVWHNAARKTHWQPGDFDDAVCDYIDTLYGVALRFTRDVDEARSLTERAVIRALCARATFPQGAYIKPWLLTILRNMFINGRRREARGLAFVETNGVELVGNASHDGGNS